MTPSGHKLFRDDQQCYLEVAIVENESKLEVAYVVKSDSNGQVMGFDEVRLWYRGNWRLLEAMELLS